MKTKLKPTASIIVTLMNADNQVVDVWIISYNGSDYTIQMCYPQNHHAWLGPFDTNRRQYEFYTIALSASEAEVLSPLLKQHRDTTNSPINTAANMPGVKFKPEQLLMMRLCDKGFRYDEIAEKIPCSMDTVKQFFSRTARSKGFANGHVMVKYAVSQKLI